jgi:hypothetical protein
VETSPYSHSYSRLSSDRTTEARSTVCWNSEPSRRPEPRLAAANPPPTVPLSRIGRIAESSGRDGLSASVAQDRQVLARADKLKEAARRCGPLLSLRGLPGSPRLFPAPATRPWGIDPGSRKLEPMSGAGHVHAGSVKAPW